MKFLIGFIIFIMLALLGNIVAYAMSEDYRFFLKKIKYKEEIVYEQDEIIIEDTVINGSNVELDILKDELLGRVDVGTSEEGYTFLDVISGNAIEKQEEQIPGLTWTQEQFVSLFDGYDVGQLENNTSLFDITTEYPDPYYEYYGDDLSIYVFSTKTYEEVQKIFEVLSGELPYTLNEVDNFGQASLYINLENAYRDETVRIVLKHKNKAFGLKIKKDSYNAIKTLLEENL